jgi:hypothetical protein
MAYSTTNPPQLISQTFGGTPSRPNLWSYASTDPVATVCGAGYVSNASVLDMGVGDLVFVLDTNSTLGSIAYVSAVSTAGAATLLSSFTTT